MEPVFTVLLGSAVGVGLLHTILGVDHWLPFVVLGRAQHWSLRRMLVLTTACGLGHVLAALLIGGLGIGLGLAATDLAWLEASRGSLAAWLLIGMGLTYAAWSFARERRRQQHAHPHIGGWIHASVDCDDPTEPPIATTTLTAWSLFVVFILGPCEPLIPMLMLPAFDLGLGAALAVGLAFGVTTLVTMLCAVTIGYFGLQLPSFRRVEAHAHTLAGLAIAVSGVIIRIVAL